MQKVTLGMSGFLSGRHTAVSGQTGMWEERAVLQKAPSLSCVNKTSYFPSPTFPHLSLVTIILTAREAPQCHADSQGHTPADFVTPMRCCINP